MNCFFKGLFLFFLSTQLFSAQHTINNQEMPQNFTFELGIILVFNANATTYGVGTLVSHGSSCVVVTAAHVVAVGANPKIIFVPLDNQESYKKKTYLISDVVIHPEFKNSGHDLRSGFDIALLKITPNDSNNIGQFYITWLWLLYNRCFANGAAASFAPFNSTLSLTNVIHPSGLEKLEEEDGFYLEAPLHVGYSLKISMAQGTFCEFFFGSSAHGKLVAYKDLPLQSGYSGAPIFRTIGSTRELLGVHSGEHTELNFRFATLITKRIKSWIMDAMNKPIDNQTNQTKKSVEKLPNKDS